MLRQLDPTRDELLVQDALSCPEAIPGPYLGYLANPDC